MAKVYVGVHIQVYCRVCGEGLDAQEGSGRWLEVSPCDKCTSDARDAGYQDGLREGREEERE